jgi:hypothetical protein
MGENTTSKSLQTVTLPIGVQLAPDFIMRLIRCGCKSDTTCSTRACGCITDAWLGMNSILCTVCFIQQRNNPKRQFVQLFFSDFRIQCKTNTLTILMHQIRISTIQVSSLMFRLKKLEIRGKNVKTERAVG